MTQPGVAGLSLHNLPNGHFLPVSPPQDGTQIPGQSAPSIAMQAIFRSYVHLYPSLHPSPDVTLQGSCGGGKHTPVQLAAIEQLGVARSSSHEVPSGHGFVSLQVGAHIPGQSKPSTCRQNTSGLRVQ
jgi:hypothetical protein